ncbi:MAG: hypothetical protein ACOX75_02565 [Lachnospiraceae bacterium]|jgi:magnesium-transporting ATPase (P-type)
MATEKKIIRKGGEETVEEKVSTKNQVADNEEKPVKKGGKKGAAGLRVGAVILWVVALAYEIVAILLLSKQLYLPFPWDIMWTLIGFIVIDLICVVIAALLWKKSNRIAPFRKKDNKIGFYIMSQLGLIMAIICLLPLVVLLLVNKNLDKKTKRIVSIIAIIALVIAAVFSIDYNPISAEEKTAAEAVIDGEVYWSTFGRKYHIDTDCQSLTRTETLYGGSVTEAIEAGRESLCAFCARNHEIDVTDIKVAD